MSTDAPLAPGRGHETRDVRIRPIVLAFVGLGIVALIVQVVTYFMLAGFTAQDERRSLPASPLAATEGRKAPPEPRLQIAPRDDLRRLRARENALLDGYGWVDRGAGVARIPIDRAMDLLAQRGLPATVPTPASGAVGTKPQAGAEGSR